MKKYNTLVQAQNCFIPLTIEGAENYEIGRISFFDKNGVLTTYNKGGIELWDGCIKRIILDHPIVIKRKIDFTIKSHFAVIDKLDYWYEKRYTLYLNIDLLENCEIEKDIKGFETPYEIEYFTKVSCLLNYRGPKEKAPKKRVITFDCGYKYLDTEEGIKCKEYADICKKNHIDIDRLTFRMLTQLFDIKLKKDK